MWCLIGCICWGGLIKLTNHFNEQRHQSHTHGFKAYKAGVPANANPEKPGSPYATQWLNGWMEAAAEEKKP